MIYGTLEGQRLLAVSKREHPNRYPAFEQRFTIGAGLRVGNNLLVSARSAISGDLGESHGGKVESVEKRGIIKCAGTERAA